MTTFTTYINAKRTGSVDAEFAAMATSGQRAFGQLTKSANEANRAISGLSGGRGTGGRSPIGQAYLAGFDQAKIKADRLAESQARLARENSSLVRGLRTTGQTLQVVQGPLGPIAGRVTAAADALVRLTGVTLGLAGAGAALFAYVRAANQFVEIRSKLAPLYDDQTKVNGALNDVFGIAQRARSGLAPVVDLYSKLTMAARSLGINQERVNRLTELSSKAATLSGGSAQSREAGLYQFSQAVGSNQLGGDELRSVRENIPVLAQELARGLAKLPDFKGQADGSIASLKKLGEQGKLTADVIARAMEASAGDIETRFARLPPTLSTAFTSLSNNATMFVGRFEEATGIVGTLASGVMLLGNNLNVVVGILGGVAAGWAAVAAAAKVSEAAKGVDQWLTGLRAQQTAAQQQLGLTQRLQASQAARVAALKEEQAAIQANVAALEAEAAAQRQLSENAAAGAKIGLPGAVGQRDQSQERAYQATQELAQERQRLITVNDNVAAAERRLETANSKVTAATSAASKTSSIFKSGLSSLLGAINPVGIAVGLATTAFLEWAMAESEAEKNAKKVEDAQRKLATVIDFTTGKVREQNDVLLANARLKAGEGAEAAGASHDEARRQLYALGNQFRPRTFTGRQGMEVAQQVQTTPGQRAFLGALDRFQAGGTVQELQRFTENLAKTDPSMRALSNQVTRLAGDAQNAARQVMQMRASIKIINGTANDQDRRIAAGDFSGGRAEGETPGRNVGAEVEALRKRLADQRYAAQVQMNESLANLEKRRSQMTIDDYIREKAQIERSYDAAIEGINKQDQRAAERAQREEERRQKAHERELKRIEEENQRRQARTEERANVLGNWSDEPPAIEKARRDMQRLQDLVGKTQNGLAAITSDNPLGQGIYTQEMANADAARIQEGLQRPYEKFMEARQRDLNVSQLMLQGRDLEAQALQHAYELYDQIGSVTMDQYQSILQSLTVEEQINDALADRQRLLAPLQNQVENFRSAITDALEALESGTNPLKVGQNFLKSMLASFNKASAEQLTARLTAGMDARLRDMLRGSNAVDSKIAEYIGALDKSGTATTSAAGAMDNVKSAANQAADALRGVAAAASGGAGGQATDLGLSAGGGITGALLSGGSSIISAIAGAAGAGQIPASFFKAGVQVGNSAGTNILYNALGKLGGVITENLRPQSRQNAYYAAGLTTARVSDHTTSQDAYDVRLPAGMSFARATDLVRKQAQAFGMELVKALDETQSGGTGRHAHYVFGPGAGRNAVTDTPAATAVPGNGMIGSTPTQVAVSAIKTVATVAQNIGNKTSSAGAVGQVTYNPDGSVNITASRAGTAAARAQQQQAASPREVYNQIGGELGGKLDKLFGTKFFTGIGKQFGNAMQGIQYGQMASAVGGMLGIKQSGLGSTLGGAAGGIIGSMIPGIGTALGGAIGGFLGGTIGGLFGKKTPHASATVSATDGTMSVGEGKGNDASAKKASTGMATDLGDAIQSIVDQLDATLGNFAVSVGMNNGHYVVDTQGLGRTRSGDHGMGDTPQFDSAEEAIQYALMDAIKDGAIAGLSAASENILKKAKSLQTALNKVQIIESIPKRLMALKDPVRYAVTELNSEFSKMISYLKEGGATAEQYAQAQELYDLERQKAIEQASQNASSAIQNMLDSMLNSSQSPLNRATVYQNAQAKLQGFAGDIQAGKVVDSDALVKAAQDFQDASRGLYGSTSSFFDDFNYLVGLLNQAKTNITGSVTTPTDLPASPFDAADIQALIHGTQSTTDAVNTQTQVLGGLLQDILNTNGGGGGSTGGISTGGSAIDLLPSSLYVGTGLRSWTGAMQF